MRHVIRPHQKLVGVISLNTVPPRTSYIALGVPDPQIPIQKYPIHHRCLYLTTHGNVGIICGYTRLVRLMSRLREVYEAIRLQHSAYLNENAMLVSDRLRNLPSVDER